jgi:hypothetical protein
MTPPLSSRNRLWLSVAIVIVIIVGLASRKFPFFPAVLGKFPGDALWALMVFFGWAFVGPRLETRYLALIALTTSYAVEFAQLYQAPWINAIRSTTVGHLVLGSTFVWADLIAYAVGVGVGVVLDQVFLRKTRVH